MVERIREGLRVWPIAVYEASQSQSRQNHAYEDVSFAGAIG